MAYVKSCACKGIRTCIICETYESPKSTVTKSSETVNYIYCAQCNKAWALSHVHTTHSCSDPDSLDFSGIAIETEFVTPDEESTLVEEIYKTTFVESQSGRRKQDYGPKVNFKKKKLNYNSYSGLPEYSQNLYQRIQRLPYLRDFHPIELCNLEYTVDRGSAIDPHFDDFWLWGERLVSLNLLSSTVLSFTKPDSPLNVSVLLPRRSLVTVFGDARYTWQHGIHREDITGNRVVMTMRELSREFNDGGENAIISKTLVDLALKFNGKAVVS